MFVEPDRALRAAGTRQERRGQLCNLFQRLAVVGDAGGLLQWLSGENQMRRGGQEPLAQRHRTIDIDNDGNAAPAGFDAELGAERRTAALGQDGVTIFEQFVSVGQLDFPQFRIAERHDGALAGRVDHDVGDRRHQARHVHDVLGVDALMRHLVENVAARSLLGIAHRPADRGPAAEPHDPDRAIERVAAADLLEMGGVLLGAACGQARHAERQVAHRHADAQDARGNFGRSSVKVHRLAHHVRPAP